MILGLILAGLWIALIVFEFVLFLQNHKNKKGNNKQ